ncbi:bidirectional sugar transporter SWEET12-like isoform X2 [Rhodamnia argentea]|nr:bidirectional sugar transporter SWEET12-like isoform X2 [Rhodamnia argentea]
MLWLYYASLKSESGAFLLITVNSVGCVIETIYIGLYLAYAPKQARMLTLRLLILLNFGGYCSILLLSHFLAKGSTRVQLLGWICVALSIAVFAAPLSVIRMVIRTKSVEFMPFSLSFFLTLSAVTWLLYGLFLKDLYVAGPNVLGVIFGVLQMALHAIYRKGNMTVMEEEKNDTSIGKLSCDIQSCNAHAIASHINTIVLDKDKEKCERSFIVFIEASDKGSVATPSEV